MRIESCSDHHRHATCSHCIHGEDPRASKVLTRPLLAERDQLVNVVDAKTGISTVGVLGQRHTLAGRLILIDVKVEAVATEDFDIVDDRHLLDGRQLESFRREESLLLQGSAGLQGLVVVLLVGGVLVDDEQMAVESGDDEAQVELPKHLQPLKVTLCKGLHQLGRTLGVRVDGQLLKVH